MTKRKFVTISIILILVIATASLVIKELTFKNKNVIPITPQEITATPGIPKSHLIRDVPYVSQETDFFCFYASCTMIFQYLERGSTLHEVLYYSGVGYSHVHQNSQPIVGGGYQTAQLDNDMDFLSTIYGLSFDSWIPDSDSLSDDECWQEYWVKVKENISHDLPVLTGVDPFILPSIRQQFDVPENIWDKFYPGAHTIVVVGYNETNRTVCYNDPAAEYYGNANYGIYAWMSLIDFREAIDRHPIAKYLIYVFHNVSDPLSDEDAFELAHKRNIERLKGNSSAYDSRLGNRDDLEFGICASKALKDDFARGIKHRIRTSFLYRYIGMQSHRQNRQNIINSFLWKIPYSFLISFNPRENEYGRISLEKQYTAEYLKTLESSQESSHEATLFEQEAKQWYKLSSNYNLFLKRGFFISLPRMILVIKTMRNILDDIISTEENIITVSA